MCENAEREGSISERIKREKKKVQYFDAPLRGEKRRRAMFGATLLKRGGREGRTSAASENVPLGDATEERAPGRGRSKGRVVRSREKWPEQTVREGGAKPAGVGNPRTALARCQKEKDHLGKEFRGERISLRAPSRVGRKRSKRATDRAKCGSFLWPGDPPTLPRDRQGKKSKNSKISPTKQEGGGGGDGGEAWRARGKNRKR